MTDAQWIRVTTTESVPRREGRAVSLGGWELAIFNLGDRFLAVENRCPHQGGPLADGIVSGCTVVCPLHAWRVRLDSGQVERPGGAAGKSVRQADLLVTVDTTEAAIEAAELFFQYYREHANYLERTYDFVVRVGMDKVRKDTVYATIDVRAGLLDRLRKSKARSRDAWEEGRDPVHPSQFIPLRPLEEVGP